MKRQLSNQNAWYPKISKGNTVVRGIFWAIAMGFLALGCSKPSIPTPTQSVVALEPTSSLTPTNTLTPSLLIINLPVIFFGQLSPSLTVTTTPTLTQTNSPPTPSTPSATPTPCTFPKGWVIYTIQVNDTLFDLARETNTTVAEIQNANCRNSNNTLILVGAQLYLPMLPPINTPLSSSPTATFTTGTPTTLTPSPTITNTPTSSPTSTPTHIPIVLAPGGGNDPGFTPCETSRGFPWIDTENDTFEIGQRQYFFACEFPESVVQANVTLSDGSVQNVPILASMPNPVLQQGTADVVVIWSALPTQPIGTYTMTLLDSGGNQNNVPFQFFIELPTEEYILAVPAVGSPGFTLDIYYVNFDLNTSLGIELFREQSFDGTNYTFTFQNGWDVTITNPLVGLPGKGWISHSLTTSPSDPLLAFLIHHQLSAYTIYWLK